MGKQAKQSQEEQHVREPLPGLGACRDSRRVPALLMLRNFEGRDSRPVTRLATRLFYGHLNLMVLCSLSGYWPVSFVITCIYVVETTDECLYV